MAVIPSQLAIRQLGRMTAASVDPKLTDDALADALVMYALADVSARLPGTDDWVETYDFYGAAIEALGWKKIAVSSMTSFQADGNQFSVSDVTKHLEAEINRLNGIRMTGTIVTGVPA